MSCANASRAACPADGHRRDSAFAIIDTLAGIHAFDWKAGGLADYGRPDGYLERQVPRWLGQLERYRTRPLPEVDEAGRMARRRTRHRCNPAVIHGDYKLDNVMFAAAAAGTAQRGRRLGAVDDR